MINKRDYLSWKVGQRVKRITNERNVSPTIRCGEFGHIINISPNGDSPKSSGCWCITVENKDRIIDSCFACRWELADLTPKGNKIVERSTVCLSK
jgi:hypothetical protein